MSILNSFSSGAKTLDSLSDIISNPSASTGDLLGHLTSTLPETSLDNIISSLGDLAQIPSVQGLTNNLTDTINTVLGSGNISSFLGEITDQNGMEYTTSDSIGSLTANDVNKVVSGALDSLNSSGILSDSKLSNISSDLIAASLGTISNSLSGLFGSDYVGWTLTNTILDQISGTFNNLQVYQSSPEASSYQIEQYPPLNLTSSDSALNDVYSAGSYDANIDGDTRSNPLDPNAIPGKARPNDRVNIPIGTEPTYPFKGRYPYNKSYRSEGGHLIEIDDTPGEERLLDQHVSGTYQEMHPSGDHVIKVVGSNYMAVAQSNKISIEGDAHVYVGGTCRLHIGGAITIVADGGINIVSKGDFRVKAKSINLESSTGDVNIKSAHDTLITTKNDYHVTSKTNQIDSSDTTSMTVGSSLSVDAQEIGINSNGSITAFSSGDISLGGAAVYTRSSGDINVSADGAIKNSGSSIELDGDLNVKSTTNMKAGTTDVIGSGADAAEASDKKPTKPIKAKSSYGSSINYSADPQEEIMANDDDPEAMAQAIKRGLQNGTITADSLRGPTSAVQSDTTQNDNGVTGINTPTIGNIGPTPSDNVALSPHFKLYDLTKGCHFPHALCAQHGLTVSQIVGNLQLVAVNILEKVKAVYPDVFITSAFRPGNSKSQHERGMAVDMQFHNGSTPERCMKIAQWIKANLAFDQLILEYSSPTRCWVHCSYNGSGNRSWSDSTKIMTMIGGKYTPGLHQY